MSGVLHYYIRKSSSLFRYSVHVYAYVPVAFKVCVMQIMQECTWKLNVAGIQQPENCSLLRDIADQLLCVSDVVNLLSILDSSKICVGNEEEKFKRVAELQVTFKDKTGKLIVAAL